MAQVDIARLRARLGGDKPISQTELAKRVGVDQSTISRWETGEEPSGPAAILLQQMAKEVRDDPSTDSHAGAAA